MNMRTKKLILSLVAASLTLFSCEKYIPVDQPGPEKMLLVNALMSTGDTLHTVYAGISTYEKADRLESGSLECRVNGKLVAATDKLEKTDKAIYHNAFRFRADFKAGDEVSIAVESDGMRAEAKTVVLDEPLLAGVDTMHVYKKDKNGNPYKALGLGVHVKDRPDEKNYYMLQVWESGGSFMRLLEVDNSSEPLLNTGMNLNYDSDDPAPANYFANRYNIFTDKGFEGSSHVFKVSLGRSFRSKVTVRLLALDRKAYNYINAAWFEESDLSALAFFAVKPYPTNVTGDGLGLVSVMTSSDYEIN